MLKQLTSWVRSLKQPEEVLSSAAQLKQGDMLRFSDSHTLPEEIRDQPFKVKQVASYFYGDDLSPQLVIAGDSNQSLYLTFEEVDGEPVIQISKTLKRKDVNALIGWDTLKKAMKNDDSISLLNDVIGDAWLAATYEQRVCAANGRYFEQDVRESKSMPQHGEVFTYHEFFADGVNKSLEVEVWEGNEIEVTVGILCPLSDIEDFWRQR